MQSRELILGAVFLSSLAFALSRPASAAPLQLTQDEKNGIMTRCLKAGGTLKACCAAVNGTYTPGSAGNDCTYKGDSAASTGGPQAPKTGVTAPAPGRVLAR